MVKDNSKKGLKTPTLNTLKRQSRAQEDFPIIAIGASAGGLEALDQFFANMPGESGMAFVIIQHLDPNHVGIMPELLQRTTVMKVLQVTDHMCVKQNHMYVLPPNKSMAILNRCLHLFEPTEVRGLRLPIDIFFRSLADDQQEKSIGIILSGMGSDGSLGLKAIKEKGGIVLVQDPLTSKFNGMPGSALASVSADIVAAASELPSKLLSFLKLSPSVQQNLSEDKNKNNLQKIIILLRTQTGHDFSLYKKNTLYRRIERRMNIHQLVKITSYVRFLQSNPSELEILFKELLIGVTNFFRDEKVWDMIRDQLLPDLFKVFPNGHIFRVWITACSTGEEAYSFALVFWEAYEKVKHNKSFSLQIFATDINKDAIDIARKGVFNKNISTDVSPERLAKYFTSGERTYSINTSIREMIVFAPHDVIKDPPFTKLDFLFCRNLLIYMESELQRKLMNLFYYCLNTGGYMVLGTSEAMNLEDSLFIAADPRLKIYKRLSSIVEVDRLNFPNSFSKSLIRSQENIPMMKSESSIQSFTEQLLIEKFTPSSVLINKDGDILYITGRIGKYLEPAAGKANMNIYAMAREGLRNELMYSIRKAKQNFEPIVLKNIKVGTNGGLHFTDITIQSIEKPEEFRGTIILVFEDAPVVSTPSGRKTNTGRKALNSHEQELELELNRTLEDLRTTREEMQTSQEELKSTNEELQSTNEELQSTNEELTTSKEEMQSLNEELQTVNLELQTRIGEFLETNNDMKNLLNSTDIATLFLDKTLNIRRYTDQLTKIIRLRQTDLGRPFTEMVSELNYPEIEDDAKDVLRTLVFKEKDIEGTGNKWFKVRIMPYRTFDERIDGAVITFIDISIAKNLENELKDKIKILQDNNLYKP